MISPLLGRSTKKKNHFHISPNRFQPPHKTPLYKSVIVRVVSAAIIVIYMMSVMSSKTYEVENPFNLPNVEYYDLGESKGTNRGWERGEQVLMCVPLRDAEPHISMFFNHLKKMTYPHGLIDIAFLVSDSKDNTLSRLLEALDDLQGTELAFGEISVIEKDFGQAIGQSFSDRHAIEAQASQRKLMAKARNWLLTNAIKAEYSWVYWRDADVESIPATILEDLMHHDEDVIVPNVWRPLPEWLGGEQLYDLNSWQESETALQL
ncbi:Mannan polymerase II complex ANP1 subunit, partial [Neolecta irregularis DAH-3]